MQVDGSVFISRQMLADGANGCRGYHIYTKNYDLNWTDYGISV